MIQGHGNDIYLYDKGAIKIDFSSNIAYNNQSDRIIEYLSQNLRSIKNYPDPSATNLKAKIATKLGLPAENVMVVNGSAEAFYLVAHFLSYDSCARSVIFTPSFAEYEDSCSLHKHKIDYVDISEFESFDYSNYNSVWLGVPNNPNGVRVPSSVISDKSRNFSDCWFVLDMAYNNLSSQADDMVMLQDNMIQINSLTKLFGIPGLRLGYIVASSDVIERLTSMRAPWSVNAPAIAAGEWVMDNYSSLEVDIDQLLEESQFLQSEIAKIDRFRVVASQCNFFLCEIVGDRDVAELKHYLVSEHGILIRDCSNFRGLTDRYFRVAAQSRESNIKLIKALKLWR